MSDDDWIRQTVEKRRTWMRDRGFPYDEKLPDYVMRYIERLETQIDEAVRWCQPSTKKVEPTSMKGAFFRGTVTPTTEAVLAMNVIRILNKTQPEQEEAR